MFPSFLKLYNMYLTVYILALYHSTFFHQFYMFVVLNEFRDGNFYAYIRLHNNLFKSKVQFCKQIQQGRHSKFKFDLFILKNILTFL